MQLAANVRLPSKPHACDGKEAAIDKGDVRSLTWNGGETGWTFAELSVPETADDRLESSLCRSDSKRRQTSLVSVSQILVRL